MAFSDRAERFGYTCTTENALVQKCGDGIILIKSLAPISSICIETGKAGPRKIALKIRNISPCSFRVKAPGLRETGRGVNHITFECSLSPGKNRITTEPAPKSRDFTFAVAGDPHGNTAGFIKMLKKARDRKCLFAIITGDITDDGREEQYDKMAGTLTDSPIPIYCIPGNHDSEKAGLERFRQQISPLDYSFDFNGFRFIMLDNCRYRLENRQWEWLKSRLKMNKSLVFMHIPPFVPFPGLDKIVMEQAQRERFMTLMSRYDVKTVFCGHVHGFYRNSINRIPYYISGGGGGDLHPLPNLYPCFHFLLVKGTNGKLTVEPVKF